MSKPPTRKYTLDDWLALPEDSRFELIDGELIQKAVPFIEHGRAQAWLSAALVTRFDCRVGRPDRPGGWWFGAEVDVQLGGSVLRPDLAGWRRDRHAELPHERPLRVPPDWICEVVSDSNRSHDTRFKVARYHQAAIGHYWILDEPRRELTVYRYMPEGYVVALLAGASDRVRAEPFEAIELHVAVLLGDDPDD